MNAIPSFLRSALPTAPAAPVVPAVLVPVAALQTRVGGPQAGTNFAIDLFTPSTAQVAAVQAVRTGPTIDDLEGPVGAGAYLPTGSDDEPTGGGMGNRGLLTEGARGPEVERLQRALAAAGFSPGTADGDFGRNTARALRAYQAANGLEVDGDFGPNSRRKLFGEGPAAPAPSQPAAPAAPGAPADAAGTRARLNRGLRNRYAGGRRKCFKYAWAMIAVAGGRGIGNAQQSRAGRGTGTANIQNLVNAGQIRTGDVIYVNRSPGADPSSTNLRYGPHWFVYMGNNQFADQYGIRGAQAMSDFVPGRKIDTIYRTMA